MALPEETHEAIDTLHTRLASIDTELVTETDQATIWALVSEKNELYKKMHRLTFGGGSIPADSISPLRCENTDDLWEG